MQTQRDFPWILTSTVLCIIRQMKGEGVELEIMVFVISSQNRKKSKKKEI